MNKVLLVINIILKALDVATTAYLVERFGPWVEGNPIIKASFSAFGINATFIGSFIIFCLLVGTLYAKKGTKFLVLSMIIMLIVVINNSIGVYGALS